MIHIRRAKSEDAEAILALATAFATSFAVESEAFHRTFGLLISEPQAFLAVAEKDTVISGYILGFTHRAFYTNGPVGWVEEITVAAQFRRQGIGRLLMEGFEQWARQHDCVLIALATRRAASFYESIDYRESAQYFSKRLDIG